MEDWKKNYNHNPPFHAYEMYPAGSEQNGNLTSWGEGTFSGPSHYNAGIPPACYSAGNTVNTKAESAPPTPEKNAVNVHCHYQGSGLVYFGESQTGGLLLAGSQPAAYEARKNEVERPGSDTGTSPESWSSSSSSKEGSLSLADPATWVKKDLLEEVSRKSPDANRTISCSLTEESKVLATTEGEATNNDTSAPPLTDPKKQGAAGVNNPKGKVRTAFSERQMSTLVQHFTVHKYLTPSEMKSLAELTGLTYKQVKTWFQNRRMKLRRHQKDTIWASERCSVKENIYSNMPSHMPPYQGEARPPLREHFNQHMMEATFNKTTPQNLPFLMAAVGSAAGSPWYPSWSSTSPQAAVPNTSQVTGWSMTPGVSHYVYNPGTFNLGGVNVVNNVGHNPSFESKDGEPIGQSTMNAAAIVHNGGL
ncbi:homeobox protein DBX1-like [Acanthochromis polyacanthus]|uniref:homeobox protein DBX1-like n=1 Tax=Acanthochromis polyacanthus TaxID=80966 RepID=UPI002234A155|nr:homeobox protein DBX1-like [Acanthochromis polyacanthus]